MAWRFSLFLLPTFVAGVVTIGLAAYAWRKRDQRAAVPFTVMMLGLSIWSLGYGIELGFTSLGAMLFWDKIAFVGSVIVPTAWFLLAVEHAGYESMLDRKVIGALTLEPVVTLALVWTNEFHGLIWRSTAVDATGPITIPRLVFGPAYWVNFAYSYLLFFVGAGLFAYVLVHASRLYRRQSLLMVSGAVIALGVNAAFHVSSLPDSVGTLDLTTFVFAVSSVFFALALFRFQLLGLAPVARETLFEEMDDGVVVLNADDRVVDANPTARRAVGGEIDGRPIGRTPLGTVDSSNRTVVTFEVGETTRTYEASRTMLTDFRDDVVGSFVLLRDITELQIVREQEQRLSVLNRILRHNIRNELNVVRGRAGVLREAYPESSEHVDPIERAAGRILDISEKVEHVRTPLGMKRSTEESIDVAAVARATADRLDDAYPAAEVHLESPREARAWTVGREQVAAAVENIAENAIRHNPRDDATVEISVRSSDRTVQVDVRDNGPGIPDHEVTAIRSERETALEHGSGLGLWIAQWVADASDGRISVETSESTGSVVSLELPATTPEPATAP